MKDENEEKEVALLFLSGENVSWRPVRAYCDRAAMPTLAYTFGRLANLSRSGNGL